MRNVMPLTIGKTIWVAAPQTARMTPTRKYLFAMNYDRLGERPTGQPSDDHPQGHGHAVQRVQAVKGAKSLRRRWCWKQRRLAKRNRRASGGCPLDTHPISTATLLEPDLEVVESSRERPRLRHQVRLAGRVAFEDDLIVNAHDHAVVTDSVNVNGAFVGKVPVAVPPNAEGLLWKTHRRSDEVEADVVDHLRRSEQWPLEVPALVDRSRYSGGHSEPAVDHAEERRGNSRG